MPILRVLQAPSLLDTVCLVTIDGAATFCDCKLRGEVAAMPSGASAGTRRALKRGQRAVWAELVPLPAGSVAPLAIAVLFHEQDGSSLQLQLQPIRPRGSGEAGVAPPLTRVELLPLTTPILLRGPSEAPLALSGCCLVPEMDATEGNAATLSVLWADGRLQLWDVPLPTGATNGVHAALLTPARSSRNLGNLQLRGADGSPPPTAASAAAKAATRNAAASASAASVRSAGIAALPPPPCSLLALQSPQMLLFARATPSDGSTESGGCRASLQVWETRWGMLHSQRTPDLSDRLAPRGAAPLSVDAAEPIGAALCGGGKAVALAFGSAVLVCPLSYPAQPLGLAHSLGTAQRTCDALAASAGGGSLLRPPLCQAPHIGDLLPQPRRGAR